MALQILYPNGEVMACQMYIWDVNTLSPVVWDGSVNVGPITIGAVDQGAAGTDPWLVELSGSSTVSVDNFPTTQLVSATNLDIRDLAFATDKVDVSGSSGVGVTGPLTDTQLRASAVPTSLATIPNPSNLDVALSTRTKPSDQQHTIIDSGVVTSITNPVTVTGTVTATVPNPLPISAASLPLPTGAATLAAQTQPGVDIGDVTINNAAGVSAVNIQDGGNSITIDGAVTLSAGSAVIGHVITDSGSTTVVTGNVTVVQPTGTNLHTVIDSGSTVVTQPTGTNLHVVTDSGTITTVSTVTSVTTVGTITNAVTVTATDLDIRNLVFATDKVDVSGSSVTATVSGSVTVTSGNIVVTNAGTFAVQDSAAEASLVQIDSNTDSLITAQDSVATSTVGPMVQGKVDFIIPSPSDNTIVPLSLNQSARLRVITDTEDAESAWDQLLPDPFNLVIANSGFDLNNKITIDTAWEN